MLVYRCFFFLVLLLCALHTYSQNIIGIPTIVNYNKENYNAGSQNWGLAQDRNGIIYVANNQGLLTFDGNFWRKYLLPNKTNARSVAVDADNRIYVGGQSEFGYFSAGKDGSLVYTSLMPLLEEKARDFTDVWNISFYNNHVFFRAYRKIFEYDRHKIIVHDGIHWSFMGSASDALFAFEYNKGLVRYDNRQWVSALQNDSLPRDISIRSSIAIGQDSILLATLSHGLYIVHKQKARPFITKDIEAIAGQNLYGATMLSPDRIALITNLSGCIIIDRQGRFVQRFTKKEGIQNNNVLSLLLDRDKNLWLGLDNGIDLIQYSNAIRNIYPESEDRNAGYASIVYNNQLYLGLASGAYVTRLDKSADLGNSRGSFTLVKNSKGQVWDFSVVNGRLLIGHNGGAYAVKDNEATALDLKTGFWDYQLLNGQPGIMIAGTYNGINFYNFQNGQFFNPRIHSHFESARFVVQYGHFIWVAHPVKGLYQVDASDWKHPTVHIYQDRKGILSNNHNKIFRIGEKMILISDKGIFTFDDHLQDFVPATNLEQALGKLPLSYLKEDPYGNVWFVRDGKIGVWDRQEGKERVIYLPELNNRIQSNGFENITIIDSNNVLVAAERGFFHINYSLYKRIHLPLSVYVRNVRALTPTDSLLYGGYSNVAGRISLPYRMNSLHFEASALAYGQHNTIEYSYLLEGFDKTWSGWSGKTEKDYTNLPEGNYVFRVKCRTNYDHESPVASFPFHIDPPWYRTWWSFIVYSLLLGGVLYWFYKKQQAKYFQHEQQRLREQQKKHMERQKEMEMLHQLELSASEMQIAQLTNEKLQAEVEHKNTELASSAMSLLHKAEILSRLKEDLINYKEQENNGKANKEFQKIIKLIDSELDTSQQWEQFARHFDNVHTDYLKSLKEYCPELSQTELKLAAFLRLRLSTKEIAQLLNISVRGVETSRYRLRKKLGLTNDDVNLHDYLNQLTDKKDV